MAAQGQLETAAHTYTADGCNHGLGAVFDHADQSEQIRLRAGLWRAEFANVGPAGENGTPTKQQNGLDWGVRVGAFDCFGYALAQFKTQTVDGRIIELEDRDSAFYFEASLTHAHS